MDIHGFMVILMLFAVSLVVAIWLLIQDTVGTKAIIELMLHWEVWIVIAVACLVVIIYELAIMEEC